MRLTSVEIRDFRSIFPDDAGTPLRLDLAAGVNTLVGPNNCGKSNVLRAISLALDPGHQLDVDIDPPGPRSFAHPIITLTFEANRDDPSQAAVLDAADAYEQSVGTPADATRASRGEVAFQVAFVPRPGGVDRVERILTPAGGSGPNPSQHQPLLDAAIERLRESVRFVLISSGESIESVLEGNFREILHSVVRERLEAEFGQAEQSRQGYIDGLKDSLLGPLRDTLIGDVQGLFPEVESIRLSPEVSTIEDTLSRVGVSVDDLVSTPLADKGTGVRGGLLVAMLSYLASNASHGMVFALEEPEAFLHPAAQESLRDHLERVAASPAVSLLVTSHSPFIVTRSPTGRIFCLAKDGEGRTRVAETARGDADHAPLIGGLLRESTIESLLHAGAAIPAGTEAVVLVEGDGDRRCLELTARVLGRPNLLEGLHIIPSEGTIRMIAQAVITKAATELPLVVVVDNDDAGRKARDTLIGKTFGFEKKYVLSYFMVFPEIWRSFPVEAEDLYDPELISRFVEVHGQSIISGSKKRPDEAFHYDFGLEAKELLGAWLDQKTEPRHLHRWVAMLLKIRESAGLPVPDETPEEIVNGAATITTVPDGQVLVVTGTHDHTRYLETSAVLIADSAAPDGFTHVGFYNRVIQPHIATVLADHPNLLIAATTATQLRSTGRQAEREVADVIDELIEADPTIVDTTQRVVLLSAPDDDVTIVLDQPIKNTKTLSGRPVAWTMSPRLVPLRAVRPGPATTDDLDRLIDDLEAET